MRAVVDMNKAGLLDHVLVSQDSGWYHVGEPGGGDFKGLHVPVETFLPALRKSGITEAQIRRLMVDNPRACSLQPVLLRSPCRSRLLPRGTRP